MKAVEEMSDDEQEIETISSILNTLVDQTVLQINDDIGLAERIGKRSIVNFENNKLKRLRTNNISV